MLCCGSRWVGRRAPTRVSDADLFVRSEEPVRRWDLAVSAEDVDRTLPEEGVTFRSALTDAGRLFYVQDFGDGWRHRLDLVEHVEVMIEFADALIARAFLFDKDGDPFFILQCGKLLSDYLGRYLARPYDHDAVPPEGWPN